MGDRGMERSAPLVWTIRFGAGWMRARFVAASYSITTPKNDVWTVLLSCSWSTNGSTCDSDSYRASGSRGMI